MFGTADMHMPGVIGLFALALILVGVVLFVVLRVAGERAVREDSAPPVAPRTDDRT